MNDVQSVSIVRKYPVMAAAPWVLLVGLALTVVVAVPLPGIPFLHTKAALLIATALATLVLFIVSCLIKGAIVVPPVMLLGTLWLIPVAYALSTLFSGASVSQSFFGIGFEVDTFGFILALTVVATLASLVVRAGAQYRLLLRIMGIALGIVLIAQTLIILVARTVGGIDATFNLFGSFADFASLAGLYILIALLALRTFDFGKGLRTLLLVGIALSVVVLALVNALIPWVLVGLASLGLFIEAMMRRRAANESIEDPSVLLEEDEPAGASLLAPLVVLILSAFFVVGGSTVGPILSGIFGTSYVDARPSWQSTFQVGSHTYASSPLFGSGPGSFKNEWAKFRDRAVNDTVFWNIDFAAGIGSIPTSFITTGVLGALAWIVFLGSFLLIGMRTLLFKLPSGRLERFVTVGAFFAGLYVLAVAFFSVPGPALLAVGFLAIGVFISTLRSVEGGYEWGIVFSKAPRVGFAIVFTLTILLLASIAGTYIVLERYLADLSYSRAALALTRGDVTGAEAAISRSLALAETDRTYRLASSVAVARMNQIVRDPTLTTSTAQQQFQTALSVAINAGLRATQLNPRDYQNWSALAAVYGSVVPLGIEGAYEQAIATYDQTLALAPMNPALSFVRAQLELARGNRSLAEEHLVKAIGLKRDYTGAVLLLARIKVENGQAREALEAAEAAAFLAQGDAAVQFQVGILRFAAGDTNAAVDALSRATALNPQYANAHFFLGVMHAVSGRYPEALAELEIVGALSVDNAALIAADVEALKAGRNPFPSTRLEALGIPYVPVTEPGAR